MKKEHSVSIKMPIELFEYIKENAKREHRSVGMQIINYIEKAISEKEKASA